MKPEQYFFRYAFPCAEVLLQLRRITPERFEELKKAAESGETPSREILEDTYKLAIKNLKRIAKEKAKDHWDLEVVKEYFDEEKHNDFIDTGHGTFGNFPDAIRGLCKIIAGTIKKIDEKKGIILVEYGDCGNSKKERVCRNIYNLDLKKGDKVRMHYGYVISKA